MNMAHVHKNHLFLLSYPKKTQIFFKGGLVLSPSEQLKAQFCTARGILDSIIDLCYWFFDESRTNVFLNLTFMFTLCLWTRPILSLQCLSLQNRLYSKGLWRLSFFFLNLPGDAQRLVSLLHPVPPSSFPFMSPWLHKAGRKTGDISAEEDWMCSG